jgi:hypothetical protein
MAEKNVSYSPCVRHGFLNELGGKHNNPSITKACHSDREAEESAFACPWHGPQLLESASAAP